MSGSVGIVALLMKSALYFYLLATALAIYGGKADVSLARASSVRVAPTPLQAGVINLSLIPADRAAKVVRLLFPRARVTVDRNANALVVRASDEDLAQIRTVVQGIDVRNPTMPTVEVIQLHALKAENVAPRIRQLYRDAHIEVTAKQTLLVRAAPPDQTQIRSLISSLDVDPPSAAPIALAQDTVRLSFATPRSEARAVARQVPHVRVTVSGATLILSGPADDVQKAKTLAQNLDAPGFGAKYTQVYRLHNIDAASVQALLTRSFASVKVTADKELNAISVNGNAAEHARVNEAVTQLDAATSSSTTGGGGSASYSEGNVDVVQLDSAIPGQNGAASTSAQDIAAAVQQSLGAAASDLHVTVPANSSEIVLTGSPMSIRLAKELITRLDRPQPLVVLDTEVLEVDENAARNIGLQFPGATLSSAFQEAQPTPDPLTGGAGRLMRLQPLGRTALQFTASLNFLLSHGSARVLADPRVTTVSGHTATIRAGDTINILTQTGGGVGTPVTQQLQTFNTGVTLDITPQVGPSGSVVVALHPVVNSLAGMNNGVPEIATRDTETVVQLQDNQTLVIGGLIQDTQQRQISKLPVLGDLPFVGRLFQNSFVQSERNELVIVVTPHIISNHAKVGAGSLAIPTPQPLPSIPPSQALPSPAPEPQPVNVSTPAPAPTAGV